MILAVMADLMFSVKIIDQAKKLGLSVEFVKDEETAIAKLKSRPVQVVILDLNYAAANPLGLIQRMKNEYSQVETVAFVSHVQVDLKRQAQEAGCDAVVARSAFAQKLPEILARYSSELSQFPVRGA
jgi:CheY-like chemotaxis protein